ncbi:MAG: SH3 domain-containing protein [Clostridiaceae bacterium]
MRKTVALVLAALLAFALIPPMEAQAAADYSWVRVKLTTNNATTLSFYASGSYFIEESGAEFKNGTLTVSASGGQMSVSHSSDGLLYTGKTVTIRRVSVDRTAGYMQLNGRYYLGHFKLKVTSSGYIQVVNEVPMAHYLYGVVAFEMNNLYPLDALKAQAIAAKGYVMNQMTGSGDYDIGDTSNEQVYKGYSASYTNVINAVDSTLNEVLTVNGSVLRSYFAASNGGETNLPSYAWAGRNNSGYAISIDDFDFANTLSLTEKYYLPIGALGRFYYESKLYAFLLDRAAAQTGTAFNYIDYIHGAQAYEPACSGSVRNLTRGAVTLTASYVDESGTVVARLENFTVTFKLSELYSSGVMPNGSLRIFWGEDRGDGNYYFYHARYGHGVGLSQRGAEQRAKSGYDYASILAFYYPGATLSAFYFAPPADTENVNKLPTGAYVTAVTTGSVNFRKKASASSDKIENIPKNTYVSVYSSENGWARAVYNGNVGYISEDYLKYVDAVPTPSANATAPGSTAQVTAYGRVTGSGVNFRSSTSSSSSSNVITKLAKNTVLELYYTTGSWYYASVGGTMGYISTSYVEVTGYPGATATATPDPSGWTGGLPTAAPTAAMPAAAAYGETNDSVNLRMGPSTSYDVIVELKKGVAVTIYGQMGDWYYASAGSLTGYLSKGYVRVTSSAGAATPTPTPTASGAQVTVAVGYINNGNTNFRMGPDTSYNIIRPLDKNTSLYAYSQTGSWYYVLVGGQFGYVHKDYVTITGSATIGADGKVVGVPGTSDGAIGKGVTTGGVNCRSGPSTSYGSYGTLSKGTALTLYAVENGWYKVKLSDGKVGYVSGKYVKVTESYSGGTGTAASGAEGQTVIGEGVTTGAVNFRTGPSTTAKKIVQLKKGVKITLYALQNGWYEASYNGTRGYLSASYVKVTSNTANASSAVQGSSAATGGMLTLAAGKATGTVNFRLAANTNAKVLAMLKSGETFQILGQSGDWYYALHQGTAGFINKAYAVVTSSGSAGIPAVGASQTAKSAVTTAQVNLRAGATVSAAVLQLLSKGASATVYLRADGWYLMSCGGKIGYAVQDYVKVT